MNDLKLINKLKDIQNITYEEAKIALENSNWDILDATIYLEECGKIDKPHRSVFYTNEEKIKSKIEETKQHEEKKNEENTSRLERKFEIICKWIDTYNHIFLEIRKNNKTFLRLPIIVVILLLFFTFGISIPLIIVGLIFDIEFFITSTKVDVKKINDVLIQISIHTKILKEKIKKRYNDVKNSNSRR